jgi:hypothetical protein
VDCVALPDLHSDGAFAAWSMVIVYENLSEVPREVLIADGLHLVAQTSPLSHAFTLGSPVLNINRSGQLAVLCYQGDDGVSGDTIQASSSPLSNMMNPANNFANGSRTFLGVSVAFPADLPRLIGSARSMSGFDLDTFDLTAFINPGQLVIPVQCSTTNDEYLVGMIAVSASVETTCETFTIAEHPQSQARCPGSSVQFTVGTDASNPQYRWHKNGVDLEDGRGFTGSGTNTLTIEGILAGDAGDYRCRVSTLCQISNSEPATLTVEVCCPGDFDGNGLLAVSDIFAFLSAWFAGCP